MLWVDKHRPHSLDKFTLANSDTASHLKRLVQDGDCPHLLFYGVSGAGKKTLALAVLREIFGPSVEKVKVEGKTWKLEQGDRKIEVELTTLSSNYHVEMNPSDVGTKDRYVVQEVIHGYKCALVFPPHVQPKCRPRAWTTHSGESGTRMSTPRKPRKENGRRMRHTAMAKASAPLYLPARSWNAKN
jgi:DNA polymerase III delta prime subunit